MTRVAVVLAAVLAALVIVACGGDERRATVNIAAASDLAGAFTVLSPEIEAACEVTVAVTLGSSGQLRDQVRAGAPYDLFLSADRAFPRSLEAEGAIEAGSVRDYGVGRIAILTREGIEPVQSLADLTRADIRHVTIANPDHAPYGRAAREALSTAGVWEAIQPTLVVAENIRQATEYVRGGNADAGIVALSLVLDPPLPHTLIDQEWHEPIVQSGGVSAHAANPAGARCALDRLAGDRGQVVLVRYGFEPVK
ncbi:MAG: molybdate ABC transporter substrate-binding protein [Dehalococcoidia bacterium]|nr:molybdate ABC transporter substrate-binding protein [Dehalococcoidia bacterium]